MQLGEQGGLWRAGRGWMATGNGRSDSRVGEGGRLKGGGRTPGGWSAACRWQTRCQNGVSLLSHEPRNGVGFVYRRSTSETLQRSSGIFMFSTFRLKKEVFSRLEEIVQLPQWCIGRNALIASCEERKKKCTVRGKEQTAISKGWKSAEKWVKIAYMTLIITVIITEHTAPTYFYLLKLISPICE